MNMVQKQVELQLHSSFTTYCTAHKFKCQTTDLLTIAVSQAKQQPTNTPALSCSQLLPHTPMS